MLQAPKQNLAAGDRAPNFVLPDHDGKFKMFYDRVSGRPMALLFAGEFQLPIMPAALKSFAATSGSFETAGVDLFCVSLAPTAAVRAILPDMQLWLDPERKISEAYLSQLGFGGCGALKSGNVIGLLLDANQRVLKVMSSNDGDLAQDVLDFYASRPALPAAQVRKFTAPVLIIPNLLDPEICAGLMQHFEEGLVEEGSVGSMLAGREVERIHHHRKTRLDNKIEDPALLRILSNVLGRRLAPELGKAFHFNGFQFDRFVVCRYAADREDRFRTHRDNVSPETADRRFAMTLNLNGDEYEGGELVFPEYGPDRYKPGNGGAVIFSCSLLHEALPVTKGERFALLTFLRVQSKPGV